MTRKTLDGLWRSYSEMVIPPDAPDIQRAECRLAFYAGAKAFYSALIALTDPGTDATDADLVLMQSLHDELENFDADVKRGAA